MFMDLLLLQAVSRINKDIHVQAMSLQNLLLFSCQDEGFLRTAFFLLGISIIYHLSFGGDIYKTNGTPETRVKQRPTDN